MRTKELTKEQIERIFPGLKPGMIIERRYKDGSLRCAGRIQKFLYNPNNNKFEIKMKDIHTGKKKFIYDTSIGL